MLMPNLVEHIAGWRRGKIAAKGAMHVGGMALEPVKKQQLESKRFQRA